jgi:hypothetical protein
MSELDAQEKAKKEAEIVAETELAEFMAIFPVGADEALTIKEIEDKTGIPRSTLKEKLPKCERGGRSPRLERLGKGVKTDPYRWFRC